MLTLLIVEDDDNIRLLLTQQLKHLYRVLQVDNGAEALKLMEENQVDLLITDIMMPGIDGYQLVQTLRNRGSLLPVIMLTANQSFHAKRSGFSSGTDDYLTKPFDKEELLWRIEALIRRARINQDQRITVGTITVDKGSYSVSNEGKGFELPKKEFELLFKLLSNPGRIFTRSQLFEDIWGFDSESSENTIKTHISRLRNNLREIEDLSILSVKGIGYKAEVKH